MFPGESLDTAAARVLKRKANIQDIFVEQLLTFGAPDRDPRTHVISVTYYALVDFERLEAALVGIEFPQVLADVLVPWPGETGGPVDAEHDGQRLDLAFDHDEIMGLAVQRLRAKLNYAQIGYQLLPQTFTLR